MQVLQTTFGVFHQFELARELERRGLLLQILSTFPWARLRREGLPKDLVRTFPWIHTFDYGLNRSGLPVAWLTDALSYANALAFDRWSDAYVRRLLRRGIRPDALIALSGSSLRTGFRVQAAGGAFVCDHGSTHPRFQAQIVAEEYRRWRVPSWQVTDPRDIRRQELIFDRADAVVVPSRVAARSLAEAGVPEGKVYTIPYGARLSAFRPTAAPDPAEFAVLFAGGAGLRKGVPYLLQAFAALRHPRKVLRLAGPVLPDLHRILPQLPIEGVEFLGVLSSAQLAHWMSRSHVLVLPSIEEGFGLVVPQAMACGCPIICSENTGAADLLVSEPAQGAQTSPGFTVPIRDAAALAARMQQLADDPTLQQAMGAAALGRVQAMGGWRDYGDRWQALLQQMCRV